MCWDRDLTWGRGGGVIFDRCMCVYVFVCVWGGGGLRGWGWMIDEK